MKGCLAGSKRAQSSVVKGRSGSVVRAGNDTQCVQDGGNKSLIPGDAAVIVGKDSCMARWRLQSQSTPGIRGVDTPSSAGLDMT